MSEMLVLNPRRRRRKSHAKRTHSRRRRRATTSSRRRRRSTVHAFRAHNPRRRRRSTRRRVHARRRRNPSVRGLTGSPIVKGLALAVGVKVTDGIATKLSSMLPASMQSNPDLARIGTKAALAFGLPIVLRKVRVLPPAIASAVTVGATIALGLDLVKTYIAPRVPFLSDYEQVPLTGTDQPEMLQSYEAMQLTGTDSAYGGGAY